MVDRLQNQRTNATWWLKQIFERNAWGNDAGRSLLVSRWRGKSNNALFLGMERIGVDGRMLEVNDVDVKDLLGMGRIVVEQKALNAMLKEHSSDLVPVMGGQFAGTLSEASMEQVLEDEFVDDIETAELLEDAITEDLMEEGLTRNAEPISGHLKVMS